jgi:hypothetical protein
MTPDPNPSDDAVKSERGSGLNAPTTRDVRLLGWALAEHWEMSPEARAAAIARLERVVADKQSRPRAFSVALKTLMGLSRINLAATETAIRAREHEELERRLTELEGKVPDERT